MQLPGTPSDEIDDVLATGRGDITTLFVSMATRHPDGTDAEYLRWHTLDHRPEQHRLSAVRASLRLVSTPACRAARAASPDPYDAIDHVMTYFFTDPGGMEGFLALAKALIGGKPETSPAAAGRTRCLRGAAQVRGTAGQGRRRRASVVAGEGRVPAARAWRCVRRTPLLDVDGVAGVWSATAHGRRREVGERAGGPDHHLLLPRRRPGGDRGTACGLSWRLGGSKPVVEPLLAAPFYPVVPHEWDRYVP